MPGAAAPRPWRARWGSTQARSNAVGALTGVVGGRGGRIAPGRRPRLKFGPGTRLELLALACQPVERGDGRPTQTVGGPGPGGGGPRPRAEVRRSSHPRMLAAGEVRPPRGRGWVPSPDPPFREEVTAITRRCSGVRPRPRWGRRSNEKTGLQALAPRCPDRLAGPGRPGRAGVRVHAPRPQCLRCAFAVHRGRCAGGVSRHPPGGRPGELHRHGSRGSTPRGPCPSVGMASTSTSMEPSRAGPPGTAGTATTLCSTPPRTTLPGSTQSSGFFSTRPQQCLWAGDCHSTAELRTGVVAFIAAGSRDRAPPCRWTVTGYPWQAGRDRPWTVAA